jgi:arabinose-5-phosphate isomerase
LAGRLERSETTDQSLHADSIIDLAKTVIDIEADAIAGLKERVNHSFIKAIHTIMECRGRIVITGAGKSGIIGKKIAATFTSTGTPSFFLHPADALHGDLGIVTHEDVVILISKSGEVNEFQQLIPKFRRIQTPIIALTGNMDSQLAQNADVVLDISVEKEACPYDLAPTASTTATLVMGDCLAVVLLKKKGFNIEDFAFLHPGGNLGKQFINVEEYMYTGDNVPVINEDAYMKEAVKVMTQNRGITCVIDVNGKLTGVITYGDLGRLIETKERIAEIPVKNVMTEHPKTIGKEELAVKAVSLMENHGITALIVVDEHHKPIGIIHLHDLMKEGVV